MRVCVCVCAGARGRPLAGVRPMEELRLSRMSALGELSEKECASGRRGLLGWFLVRSLDPEEGGNAPPTGEGQNC